MAARTELSPTIPAATTGLGKLDHGPGHVGLRTQEVQRPGDGEALVEVIAAGICGTDLHIEDDEFGCTPPVTMGHEVTGVVVEIGVGVDPDLVGRRVASETYFFYCEVCVFCRSGQPNLCAERQSIGSHVDGGFARWMTVPARNLHELPDRVGPHAGALAEPLACVCHCLFDPPVVQPGDRVLVIGPGTMGLLTAQAARAAGGSVHVTGLEKDAQRLAVAETLYLETEVFDPDRTPAPAFDVVAECSGTEPGATFGLESLGRLGRYVQVGVFGKPVTVPLDLIYLRDAVYTSGFASTPRSWQRAMQLLNDGLVSLDPLVGDVVPLREWERAFAGTRAGQGLKWMLDPSGEAAG